MENKCVHTKTYYACTAKNRYLFILFGKHDIASFLVDDLRHAYHLWIHIRQFAMTYHGP